MKNRIIIFFAMSAEVFAIVAALRVIAGGLADPVWISGALASLAGSMLLAYGATGLIGSIKIIWDVL